jgi:hypothetical protein
MGKGVDEMERHMHLYITYLTFILTRGAWPGLGCGGALAVVNTKCIVLNRAVSGTGGRTGRRRGGYSRFNGDVYRKRNSIAECSMGRLSLC